MDHIISKVWALFGRFQDISHANHGTLNEVSLDASMLASHIYLDYYDDLLVSEKYIHHFRTASHNVAYDYITSRDPAKSHEKILIIRGTKGFYNWSLNLFCGGRKYLGFVVSKLLASLVLMFFIWREYGHESLTQMPILEKINILLQAILLSWIIPTVAFILLHMWLPRIFKMKHQGYHNVAQDILKEARDRADLKSEDKLRDDDKLIVIGHSLGGGIGEEILYARSPNTTKGFLFNKATSRIESVDPEFRNHAVDHRMKYDILALFSFSYIIPIKMFGTLEMTCKEMAIQCLMVAVGLVIVLYKSIDPSASFIPLLGLTLEALLSINFYNHKMDTILGALRRLTK